MDPYLTLSSPLDETDLDLLSAAVQLRQITFGQLVLATYLSQQLATPQQQVDAENTLLPN